MRVCAPQIGQMGGARGGIMRVVLGHDLAVYRGILKKLSRAGKWTAGWACGAGSHKDQARNGTCECE